MRGEEWITAAEALLLVKPVFNSQYSSQKTICRRAHNGLIRARAQRLMANENVSDDVEIPKDFWWAEGEAALDQNWVTGDFETWARKSSIDAVHLRAFGVSFLRADIEKMILNKSTEERSSSLPLAAGKYVVIGHGQSETWRALKDFIQDRLKLPVDEFNRVSAAGMQTTERLSQMLNEAEMAFLVMTAEDQQLDGTVRARENVVHEIGLFQGRCGFNRAIVLLEEGCDEFSNLKGLIHIAFPKGKIGAAFEEIRRVVERERERLVR